MHNGKPTLMVRIGNGRAAGLANAKAQLNVLLSERSTEGKVFHRAQELLLERAHIPIFPLFWTLMHVMDERSPLHGYDAARTVEANAQVFVLIEARDPTLATVVHEIRNYAADDIRFGRRYADAVTTAEDGAPVLDLARCWSRMSASGKNRGGRSGKPANRTRPAPALASPPSATLSVQPGVAGTAPLAPLLAISAN
jgi:inward rectifier potassium channel-like protein